MKKLPFCDVTAANALHAWEIAEATSRVVVRGQFILGEEVEAFEQEAAAYLGVRHAVALGNGTDALIFALLAGGVGPGDEVLVPAFTIFVDAEAVLWCGATPVPVDVDARGALARDALESALTTRTRAVIAPSLFGGPVPLDEARAVCSRHGLLLVEDACQAFGAREGSDAVGARGDVGCYSFYPTKVLGGAGDGGLIVTNDAKIAADARLRRSHGAPREDKYRHVVLGKNSRLDELQAAILRVKLRHLDEAIARRRAAASHYDRRLTTHAEWIERPADAPDGLHTYYAYAIRARKRDALQSWLEARGIEAPVHFPWLVSEQPALTERVGPAAREFPQSAHLAAKVLSLPCHSTLNGSDVDRICDAIDAFAQAYRP